MKNLFKKLKKIPLYRGDTPTGQWVEYVKGDEVYDKLVKIYGLPLPKKIQVAPLIPKD